ncbi:MAG TPA: helix-turn-helix domain-containing protein [Acidimicrobiia bacterium]|nr:helix-turn-helix domain-containing protein [Acidimicrobiia bacterium]
MQNPRDVSSRPRRAYDASRRQAEASARQRRVVDAARELFLQRGYGATTIGDIAEAADVSVPSVYAAFESKAGILSRVVETAITGEETAPPVFEHPAGRAILAEPDLTKRLRTVVQLLRRSHERAAPLIQLVESARASDAALGALAETIDASLQHDAQLFIEALPTKALRRDITRQEAADLLSVLCAARNWTTLVEHCGWTPEQYERRMAEIISRLLLQGQSASAPTRSKSAR